MSELEKPRPPRQRALGRAVTDIHKTKIKCCRSKTVGDELHRRGSTCHRQRFVSRFILASHLGSYHCWRPGDNPSRRPAICSFGAFRICFGLSLFVEVRMSTNLDVKLRLSEIAQKSAELSAVSSKLADMASQLNRLRKLNGRIGFLSDRNSPFSRPHNDSYASRRYFGDS